MHIVHQCMTNYLSEVASLRVGLVATNNRVDTWKSLMDANFVEDNHSSDPLCVEVIKHILALRE